MSTASRSDIESAMLRDYERNGLCANPFHVIYALCCVTLSKWGPSPSFPLRTSLSPCLPYRPTPPIALSPYLPPSLPTQPFLPISLPQVIPWSVGLLIVSITSRLTSYHTNLLLFNSLSHQRGHDIHCRDRRQRLERARIPLRRCGVRAQEIPQESAGQSFEGGYHRWAHGRWGECCQRHHVWRHRLSD